MIAESGTQFSTNSSKSIDMILVDGDVYLAVSLTYNFHYVWTFSPKSPPPPRSNCNTYSVTPRSTMCGYSISSNLAYQVLTANYVPLHLCFSVCTVTYWHGLPSESKAVSIDFSILVWGYKMFNVCWLRSYYTYILCTIHEWERESTYLPTSICDEIRLG